MMNCRKAEQLIPLFVEADLDAAEMLQVTEHLAICDACRSLVTEYQASQLSLHAAALPTFDEAMLAEMRCAVQREIACPSNTDWLQQFWNWKPAFAVVVVLLALSSLLFFKMKQAPVVSITREQAPPVAACCGTESVRELPVGQAHVVGKSGRARSPYRNRVVPIAAAKPAEAQVALPETATVAPSIEFIQQQAENAAFVPEPEMLRMEIQTADPNIKIIWLTPKEPARTNTAPIIEATK